MTDSDSPNVAETDQLAARLRDLLVGNGLELVDQNRMDEAWLEEHTATELWDAMLETAVRVSDDGCLSTIVAVRLPAGIGYTLAIVRRQEPPSEEQS
jgi:hypothetical protein